MTKPTIDFLALVVFFALLFGGIFYGLPEAFWPRFAVVISLLATMAWLHFCGGSKS